MPCRPQPSMAISKYRLVADESPPLSVRLGHPIYELDPSPDGTTISPWLVKPAARLTRAGPIFRGPEWFRFRCCSRPQWCRRTEIGRSGRSGSVATVSARGSQVTVASGPASAGGVPVARRSRGTKGGAYGNVPTGAPHTSLDRTHHIGWCGPRAGRWRLRRGCRRGPVDLQSTPGRRVVSVHHVGDEPGYSYRVSVTEIGRNDLDAHGQAVGRSTQRGYGRGEAEHAGAGKGEGARLHGGWHHTSGSTGIGAWQSQASSGV